MKGIVITSSIEMEVQTMSVQELPEALVGWLQETVGGYIKVVKPKCLEQPYCMVINGEALLQDLSVNLPINLFASAICGTEEHGYTIIGNVVLLKTEYDPETVEDRLAGLSDEETADLVAEIRTMTGGRIRFRGREEANDTMQTYDTPPTTKPTESGKLMRLTKDHFCLGHHCWELVGADADTCEEVCRNQGDDGCTNCPIRKGIDRLAEYENTGLTPEVCMDYRIFEDEVIKAGLSFNDILEIVHREKKEKK